MYKLDSSIFVCNNKQLNIHSHNLEIVSLVTWLLLKLFHLCSHIVFHFKPSNFVKTYTSYISSQVYIWLTVYRPRVKIKSEDQSTWYTNKVARYITYDVCDLLIHRFWSLHPLCSSLQINKRNQTLDNKIQVYFKYILISEFELQ